MPRLTSTKYSALKQYNAENTPIRKRNPHMELNNFPKYLQ